jgi:hypothetical protein
MRYVLRIVTVLALAVATLVAPANAAPPDHIGLDQLRSLLAASPNGIPGYFLTVAGGPSPAQQDPVQVDMTVKAVADGQGPDGALILFEADMADPVMQDIGGIAAGMSGSPLFIDDGGGFKMIGALSYGDIFTLNGLGLATPIEYMLNTQSEWPAVNTVLSLDQPVDTDSGTVSKIRITNSDEQPTSAAHTVTMSPLVAMRVSGIPAKSAVYKRFETLADDKGLNLLTATASDCTPSGYTAPYTEGGSLGTYLGLGAVEFGGYGTVTYVDDQTAMGYGHPLLHLGQTDLFATNVWIDGIWGSSYEPYKLGCPGQIRGAVTQDRSAAVGVSIPGVSAATPVTAEATVTTNKTRTGSAQTSVAAGTFATEFAGPLVAAGATEPVYRLANQAYMAGTSRTVTTVNVTDGASSKTITRSNLWSSGDVLGESSNDPYLITAMLYSVPGITPKITSVDMTSEVDQTVNTAKIVSAEGGPLQPGPNTVMVSIKPTGKPVITVPVQVDIPADAALDVGLSVTGGYDVGTSEEGASPEQPESFDALVSMIEAQPTNDEILVQASDANGNTIEVGSKVTDFVVSGSVFPSTVAGTFSSDMSEVPLGSPVILMAMLPGVPNGQQVTFEAQTAGTGPWRSIGTAPIATGSDGVSAAIVEVTPSANTVYRASWPGNDTTLAWAATTPVTVIPPVGIEGSRKGKGWSLTLSSDPQAVGAQVVAQAKINGSWSEVGSATLGADGTAELRWSPAPAKTKVRAVIPASARFGGSRSEPLTLSTTQVLIDTSGTPRDAGNVVLGLRNSKGNPITGVKYRIQRQRKSGWETVANGQMRRNTRLWLSNGDYRVVVPAGRQVPVVVRESFTMDSAAVVITKATSSKGRARIEALPPIPLKFTIQSQQAGQWRDVGGWRRMSPPTSRWTGSLRPGRYRASFPDQSGFAGANSSAFRVR